MKKFFQILKINLLIIFLFFFFNHPIQAKDQEIIESFETLIQINKDGSLNITEKIDYNFSGTWKHGIYRDIPIKYEHYGTNYNLKISNIDVKGNNKIPYEFEILNQGKYKRIKIGNPEKLITGKKQYQINYKIERAISYLNDHDELYWNVTGNEWLIPIKQSKATIILPQEFTEEQLQKKCFVGVKSSEEKCILDKFKKTGQEINTVIFSNNQLDAQEGLTIVVGFPKNIVHQLSWLEYLIDFSRDNYIIFYPILIFLIFFLLWYKYGRDPKGRKTIITQFNAPENLSPAEVGVILDERAHYKDISAEIINLAIQGYLKINRIEDKGILFKSEDYLLEKLKSSDDLENKFQKNLLDNLFNQGSRFDKVEDLITLFDDKVKNGQEKFEKYSKFFKTIFGEKIKENKENNKKLAENNIVKLSALKNEFYDDMQEIIDLVYDSVLEKKYFPKNPKRVRSLYFGISFVIMFIGFTTITIFNFLAIICSILSAIIVMIFGALMPAKTRKGVLAYEHILGLKKYLEVAEKDRLEFHNAPEKNPEVFEKLLPYAIVLDVEERWAGQFKDLYKNNPDWYNDVNVKNFSTIVLTQSLSNFQSQSSSVLSSTPSSSGSGSGFSGGGSGGGFGGGGGGSW